MKTLRTMTALKLWELMLNWLFLITIVLGFITPGPDWAPWAFLTFWLGWYAASWMARTTILREIRDIRNADA